MKFSKILILDFGSQFTQLIARRFREINVYTEIFPCNSSLKKIKDFKPDGIVLSGGPNSVYDDNAPVCQDVFSLRVPILGICYGMQYIASKCGSNVVPGKTREYGKEYIQLKTDSELLPNFFGEQLQVWMSHGDQIEKIPDGFVLSAVSRNGVPAVIENSSDKVYAIQFHPEVTHTHRGIQILRNFAINICKITPNWVMGDYINDQIKSIKKTVGKNRVVCALSGGVDSTVAAAIVHAAVGDSLTCVFVDNGLMRKNELEKVMESYKNLKYNVVYINAEKRFLSALEGVIDPERKRKIIGSVFIKIFEAEAKRSKNTKFLVQGTLYPDVIESLPPPSSKNGGVVNSSKIKSHHNVGGLPKNLKFKLIEPLRELFKDEVREIGEKLGISKDILSRHPFPGPGLAIRVIGEVTKERLGILREVDDIFIEAIKEAKIYDKVWQAFAVLLPVQSVGVMGDGRTYENVVALRAVTSSDGMTADWVRFDHEFMDSVSRKIVNQVRGVNRVVYDVTSKPPSTIEWE